jgi:ribulose-5-phosphate 4-epimerase/fuculose-1-phosphate aldolase
MNVGTNLGMRATVPSVLNVYSPPALDLSESGELAVLLRALYDLGYDDGLAGHLVWWRGADRALTNPRELGWDEVRASDIVEMKADGERTGGRYNVSPAVSLHIGVHSARPNFDISLHGHPRWAMTWANLRRLPPIYDQSSAAVAPDLVLVDEYVGNFPTVTGVEGAVGGIGMAEWSLLANHGVFIVGRDIAELWLRAYTLEWRCRRAWEVEVAGGGAPMPRDAAASFGSRFQDATGRTWWDVTRRRTVSQHPDVLS